LGAMSVEKSEKFATLQSEFESLTKRLNETLEANERRSLLAESRKILVEMDQLIRQVADTTCKIIPFTC